METKIYLTLRENGKYPSRDAGFDFIAGLDGVEEYFFEFFTDNSFFYGDINICVLYKNKKLYLPCVPLELAEKYISDSRLKTNIRFYYNGILYTFLYSTVYGSLISSFTSDYLTDTEGFFVHKGSNIVNSYIGFSVGTTRPQRMGLWYKRILTFIGSEGTSNTDYRIKAGNAVLYNPVSIGIFGKDENSVELFEFDYYSGRPIIGIWPRYYIFRSTSEIDNIYLDYQIDIDALIEYLADASNGSEKVLYDGEGILKITRGEFGIDEGTYTIEKFYDMLSEYISENSYRIVSNDFSITDGNFTIDIKDGQKIWLCVEGSSPNFAKTIRFVSSDDDTDYTGSIQQYVSGYQNYNFYGDGNTGFANVYQYKGRDGNYYSVVSYDVTITKNISFK